MVGRWISRGRRPVWAQGELPFLRRSRRLDRAFKATIVASMMLAILGMVFGTSMGRRSSARLTFEVKKSAARLLGFVVDRADFEAQRDRNRMRGVELTRGSLE